MEKSNISGINTVKLGEHVFKVVHGGLTNCLKGSVYFISGHRDITEDEFNKYYLGTLDKLVENPFTTFVVGDYHGVDIMAQKALVDMGINPERVTVYHMFDKPRNIASDKFKTIGGFTTDEDRDAAMTKASTDDIAWIRKGKWNSGTAQNILRRHTMVS